MKCTKAALALCVCLVIVAPVLAGNTAQISGIIADESGMPIAFATIRIEGTDIHATSDEDGYFSRSDVPPGQYNVTCSAPGYVDFTYVEIPFLTDMRRNVNFTMKRPDAETVLTITVHAEHRLIEPSLTTSIDYITAEDIEQLPADSFYDLMANEAGVTNDDGFMHVRGGRATEITYMVDDMPILDAVTGYAASSVNNSAIAEMAIISGTFSAEYGNAQSAVINITTKAGSTKTYEGMIRFRQEVLQTTKEFGSEKVLESTGQPDWNSVPISWTTRTRQGRFWKGEGSVGGPLGSFMTFFLSGDYTTTGTQLIMPRPRWEYNAQSKLRFNFSPDMSFTLSGSLNQLYRPLFDVQYQYTLDNMYHSWRDTYQISGMWKHMINEKTYYTIRANYFNSWSHFGVRWGDDDWHWENDPNSPGQQIQVWNNGDSWGSHQIGDMKWWEDYDTDWQQAGPTAGSTPRVTCASGKPARSRSGPARATSPPSSTSTT
ncbi:MAG: TonB-dependent receptor [bacterium]|nr:TonB-dependent receptor [bacterium]